MTPTTTLNVFDADRRAEHRRNRERQARQLRDDLARIRRNVRADAEWKRDASHFGRFWRECVLPNLKADRADILAAQRIALVAALDPALFTEVRR